MRYNLSGEIRITHAIAIPHSLLKFRFARSSGPGGQNVNKVATKVELLFDPASLPDVPEGTQARVRAGLADRLDRHGILHIVVDESRSQWANREMAIKKFAGILRDAVRERKPRRATAPTSGSRQRRSFSKEKRSRVKNLRRRVSPDE